LVELFRKLKNPALDFVVERLGRGSILNPNLFLLEDRVKVSAIAVGTLSVLVLSNSKLQYFRKKNEKGSINIALSKVEKELIGINRVPYLDFSIPSVSPTELKLKNAVLEVICGIQEKQRKPSFLSIIK